MGEPLVCENDGLRTVVQGLVQQVGVDGLTHPIDAALHGFVWQAAHCTFQLQTPLLLGLDSEVFREVFRVLLADSRTRLRRM